MPRHTLPEQLRSLMPPIRNRYFYGKLMDVRHFEMEQRYFNAKRWLVNRLSLGAGVLCGLDVEVRGDRIVIHPGVAIDALGREIIVTDRHVIEDGRQLTDECGEETGRLAGAGRVLVSLCYHECDAEPVPAMVDDCDSALKCVAGAVRERFRIVRTSIGADWKAPWGIDDRACKSIFADARRRPNERRVIACSAILDACEPERPTCVPLAIVDLDANPLTLPRANKCIARRVIYSNTELLELLFCLADRVDACCERSGGQQPEVAKPPTVMGVWPPNAHSVSAAPDANARWLKEPTLTVSFDRWMKRDELGQPDPWLRMWAVAPNPDPALPNGKLVIRLPLRYRKPECEIRTPVGGERAFYDIDLTPLRQRRIAGPFQVLVVMRNDPGAIMISDRQGLGLDADFTGTCLDAGQIMAKIWDAAPVHSMALTIKDSGGTLPASGNGTPGGLFHSFFEVGP